MPISTIDSHGLWAISSGRHEISVTIVRAGGRGSAFAESQLTRVSSCSSRPGRPRSHRG